MCTARPCKCSIDLCRVADIDHAQGYIPGDFEIGYVKDGDLRYRMFWVVLPCEGGELHGLPINAPGEALPDGVGRPMWTWDGNEEKPTLTPSVLTWRGKVENRQEVWHGFIRAGRAESC
jgi:hypothetical protein